MKLLLDTHILLWALVDDPRLTPKARRLIEDMSNDVYYSIASPWEVQIKHDLHPDELAVDARALEAYCMKAGFAQLPVKLDHICALPRLERRDGAAPHKDPFDRIMVCQASVEGMLLLTHDGRIAEYTDPCVFAV